jgi:hypothetical protein
LRMRWYEVIVIAQAVVSLPAVAISVPSSTSRSSDSSVSGKSPGGSAGRLSLLFSYYPKIFQRVRVGFDALDLGAGSAYKRDKRLVSFSTS